MDPLIWVVLVLVLLAVAWGVVRGRPLLNLFNDRHYQELARLVAELKTEALKQLNSAAAGEQQEPAVGTTTGRLRVRYLISPRGGVYHHDCRVDAIIGRTGATVGGTFVFYIAALLGVEPERLETAVLGDGSYAARFTLDAAEQDRFAERSVELPEGPRIRQLHAEAAAARDSARFEPEA